MANEFKHKDPGSELTQAEFISSDGTGHIFDGQAAGDVLYAFSTTVLKNLAKATDGNILELASGLPAWTGSPTIGSTSWSNATHAHGADNSGGTLNTSALGAGTLAAGRGGTGITSLATGVATFLGTSSSANLRSALTDETGTGAAVFADTPTLVTPALGTPASGVLTNATGLPTAGIVDDAVTLAKMADITRGSIIYGNASGDPAALAKGTEDYVLTAGADDIAWAAAGGAALQSTVVNYTRTAAAGSGDEPYEGAGFTPTAIIVIAAGDGDDDGFSIAAGDDAAGEAGAAFYNMASTPIMDGGRSTIVEVYAQGQTNGHFAVLKTLDSDGCTFTWTKEGTGSLAGFTILYLR
jgi:hypothetical protein